MPSYWQTTLLALLLPAWSVLAQNDVNGATDYINATAPTSDEGEVTVHYIDVSNRTHYFTPNSINAKPGDIVSFKFWPGNHSVIRADYGYPCIPYEDFEGNEGAGFYSGVQDPSDRDVRNGDLPTWNLTINTTAPTFFYCGAPGSCINWGMLGAINADAEHSLAKQIKLAREAEYMLIPGEPLPADVKTSMDGLAQTAITSTASGSAATDSSSTTPASAEATATDDAAASESSEDSSSSGLSTGVIVGIAIGGAAFLALLGALFYFFGRSKTLSEQLRHSRPPNDAPPPGAFSDYGPGGGANSRHTSVLPPYAQVAPNYPSEQKPPSLTEADGAMVSGHGHHSSMSISPEMRQAEPYGGFTYADSRPSAQNMHMRYSHQSDAMSDVSRQASPPPPSQNMQVVHELPTESNPRDGRGPFREML